MLLAVKECILNKMKEFFVQFNIAEQLIKN